MNRIVLTQPPGEELGVIDYKTFFKTRGCVCVCVVQIFQNGESK